MAKLQQLVLTILMCATSLTLAGNANVFNKPEDLLLNVSHQICNQEKLSYPLAEEAPMEARGRTIGQRYLYEVPPFGKLQIEAISLSIKSTSHRITLISTSGKPSLFVALDPQCRIQLARKIIYDSNRAISLLHLDNSLVPTGRTEPVNPEVPEAIDPGGIRVGIIDSGVNYLLPEIYQRLARDTDNNILGYDYWDLDAQPFDSNPARSDFFPQRHGTRTASLLLREAPGASLVPYRYPRPDMTRIATLIEHAANNHVRIIAMPLGSNNRDEWLPFYESAKLHPEILFIISSGNNGVDIDEHPIYPAAFDLDNLITVSAADETPVPAVMTNWGKNNTDILLPADRQFATDFDGNEKMVSGTSYAVSRIAALAARVAQQHQNWGAAQIKQQILSMTDKNQARQYTAYGLLHDPLSDSAHVEHLSSETILSTMTDGDAEKLDVRIILLENSGWEIQEARDAALQAQEIYRQCNIALDVTLSRYSASDYLLDFHSLTSRTLIDRSRITGPAIFLVRDTRRLEAFGGEAFGSINTRNMPWLSNTGWMISGQPDTGIIMAHELFHILVDSGDHSTEPGNLMNEQTSPANTSITTSQCELLKSSRLFKKGPE